VDQLRTGKHPEKVRVVLDVSSDKMPEYSWTNTSNILTMRIKPLKTFSQSGAKTSAKFARTDQKSSTDHKPSRLSLLDVKRAETSVVTPPLEKKERQDKLSTSRESIIEEKVIKPETIAPPIDNPVLALQKGPQSLPLENKQAAIPPIKSAAEGETADKKIISRNPLETARVTTGEDINSAQQFLEDIIFYYGKGDGTPTLKLRLSKRPKYKLVKKDAKYYHLTIPRCSLMWDHLKLPQFPPHDFKGFSMVMAERLGRDVKITIGVDRGTRITALANETEILIKTAKKK